MQPGICLCGLSVMIIIVKLYLRVDERLSPAHTPTHNWMASPSLFDLLFGHVQMGSAEDGHGLRDGSVSTPIHT